ncbi:uncharacterized protein I206_103413 [Kwoniella pini CBS 10737]|uniref:Uncharacterized protein n=1 Tax=Kwoniella pini CBS 10737 TaxID=1296096 RepID=A0A1B9I9S7_9TREE|nr:uncharacterized protein I206_01583 [Kwoniella pini CBS 10737]OCF52296.1 hypothetical protein I206_01583 [Kwoniella pini CBS 10737]
MIPISRSETGLNIPNHFEQYILYHDQDLLDYFNREIDQNNRFIYPNARTIIPNEQNSNSIISEEDSKTTNEIEDLLFPKTHPFAKIPINTKRTKMQNSDPTNEFMYQVPTGMGMGMGGMGNYNNKSVSEGGFGIENSQRASKPLDLKALNERLQTLGLGGPSIDSLNTSIPRQPQPTTTTLNLPSASQPQPTHHPNIQPTSYPLSPYTPANASPQSQLDTGFHTNHFLSPDSAFHQHTQAFPSVTELAPGDSISMYKPTRAPSMAARSQRKGGTNVDPGEGGVTYTPSPEEAYEHPPGDGASFWSQDDITARTPRTIAGGLEDEMTIGPTSIWTRSDMGRDMYDHRDRLLRQESNRNQEQMQELQRQIREAHSLATTATKLEAAEKQLRELQARLIAEQVARTQIEQEAGLKEEEMKNYQNEWASAVRALRRARDEGKKSDEEKRRIQRCFEEARDKLWKYHEALRVREARAQGKEEGKAEAWQEAERWMGNSPPIPGIDPVQNVPGAVLHQTPMMQTQTPMFLQSPTNQYFQQQAQQGQQSQQPEQQQYQQQPQHQWQQPVPNSPGATAQMQSIAQMMEYFAQNPGTFPQFQQQGQQQVTPPQQATHAQPQVAPQQPPPQQMPQLPPHQPPTLPMQQMPTMQTPGQLVAPMLHQSSSQFTPATQPQQTGAADIYMTGYTGQTIIPQHTGQQSMAPMMPQQTGPAMISQHTGVTTAKQPSPPHAVPIPQPMMVPVMVPIAQPPVPISASQLPPNPPQPSHSTAPAYAQPTVPDQPPVISQRTPRAPTAGIHTTPGRSHAPMSNRIQATRPPPANRTGVSTAPHMPQPESIVQPHAAESYLERVDHDQSLKRMMGGARSKTIHSSAVPPTDYSKAPTRSHTAARSAFDDGSSNVDKPLPDPFPPSQVLGRSRTHRTPSTIRPNQSQNNSQKMNRRMSLSDGLHNSHAARYSQIPDGDRYPAFPIKTHSRNTSYGSVDPAGIHLPSSRDASNVHSPVSQHGGRSARQTPARSGRTSARSRVAGALRNDMELDSELPGIQEDEEEETHRHPQAQVPPPMSSHNRMSQAHMMRQQPLQNNSGPGPRPPPSMPNMRPRPNVVMPQPLGGGPPPVTGPNKTFSEPHPGRTEKGHKARHSFSSLFHHRDPAGARSEYLPEPESAYHPPRTHDLFVPPQLAPMAVSGGVEDVQGPRTSALGLSGVESDNGRMRAPTSSRSRSNHPPSAYFPDTPKTPHTQHAPPNAPRSPSRTEITQVHNKGGRQPINLDSPPAPGTTRQTVIITEKTDPRPDEIPLPNPRSTAPTAYTGFSPEQFGPQDPREVPLPPSKAHDPSEYTHMGNLEPTQHPKGHPSNAPTAYTGAHGKQPFQFPLPTSKTDAPTAYTTLNRDETHKTPRQVPLPPPKSIAPTAYTTSPPELPSQPNPNVPPQVRSIDFANVPLPRGGGTIYDMRTVVDSEPDVDEPRGPPRSTYHTSPPSKVLSTKKSYRKPVPNNGHSIGNGNTNGNGIDPRMYPLPASRAPTRTNRASTYAASVPPIEEVTEPESGRENIITSRPKVF